jgi:hypothetical protein
MPRSKFTEFAAVNLCRENSKQAIGCFNESQLTDRLV